MKIIMWVNNLKDLQILIIGILLISVIFINPFSLGIFMTTEEYLNYIELPNLLQILDKCMQIFKGVLVMASAIIGGGFIGEWLNRKYDKRLK